MVAPLEPDDPRTLGGFRISGRLGEGGQGVVYLGHAPDGAPVAVKVLKTGLDPVVRARLSRELDALRGVAPFCTARVITAMVDGREPYVVSEFVDGPSLQQRVSASGPLRGGELERLAVGTATALAAIHGAGIVHRDFKPGNVLLGPDGPRVVDFGIARQGESETITAGPVGTPAYLAPEHIAGRPATPASDVFAWGATIVFAATGRAAFGADNVAAVLHRIMTTFPDLTPLPPPLRALVGRCLAKDPAARPAARDLLLELVG
ncbi:serine/threonine-protein kinase, partial [Microbispora sp. NPDC049633]|uniref:serine/threonine-protein kinase n=1 Tax=Microbispora sp. NPDC049633 TaxID=3154355 RepID=UPI0034283B6B